MASKILLSDTLIVAKEINKRMLSQANEQGMFENLITFLYNL
jgi:hypothetical protein